MAMTARTQRSVAAVVILGLILSVGLATVVSFYASSSPDGLERVAEDTGFADTAQDSAVADSPLADYGLAGADNERLSVGMAGIIGVGVTAAVGFGLFMVLAPRRKHDQSP